MTHAETRQAAGSADQGIVRAFAAAFVRITAAKPDTPLAFSHHRRETRPGSIGALTENFISLAPRIVLKRYMEWPGNRKFVRERATVGSSHR